jgi:hypothetical protein
MRDLTIVQSGNTRARVLLIATIVFSLALGWFGIKWQIGSMLADLTPAEAPEAADIAEVATELASANPTASWLRASTSAPPDMSLYENAVRLSPADFRWRIELARAYDQNDDSDRAEAQFKKAVDLAPSYAYPHWQLGNFYLRRARTDDAFAELKKATLNNHTYREQVFSLGWDYFDKDAAKVEQLAADTPDARGALALFFAARGRADDALRIWNQLTDEQKAANPQFAKVMAAGLYSQRSFPQALAFYRELGVEPEARVGAITNPGFERTILPAEESPFGWQITRNEAKVDITADNTTKHSGSRSLRVTFRNYVKPEFGNVFQIVALEPNRTYRLGFWVLTENLKTSSPPLLQVMNANDDKLIAASKPFPIGSADWQQFVVEFRTPENCNAVRLQTSRALCGEQCPIIGTFWYDDFELMAQ